MLEAGEGLDSLVKSLKRVCNRKQFPIPLYKNSKCIFVFFSAAFQDKWLKRLVKIFFTNEHIAYNVHSPSLCHVGYALNSIRLLNEK